MASTGQWRYIVASEVGTSHTKQGLPCQDSQKCRLLSTPIGDVFVAIVSDGAGSAPKADVGSELACTTMMHIIMHYYDQSRSILDLELLDVQEWLDYLIEQIDVIAKQEQSDRVEYSCTLLCAIIEHGNAAFIQIGDGAIVIRTTRADKSYFVVFWPDQGEYVNQTSFITDANINSRLHFDRLFRKLPDDETVLDIAVFTDGLQSLILRYIDQSVHTPFFRPIFNRLYSSISLGHISEVSDKLGVFLQSDRVNGRTNDDKTLVIASCCL